ncbi:MAG: rhodanese-like domain-containing protein [Filomicrobium sp.]
MTRTRFTVTNFAKHILNRLFAGIAVCFASLIVLTGATLAGDVSIMDAPEAHEKAKKGEIVLVDVRTPQEWQHTGVPTTAHAITMHQDSQVFLSRVLSAIGGDEKVPVAIICRTGSRTTKLSKPLAKVGFTVINVVEGVVGGPRGPGWKNRGLPVRAWTPKDTGPQLAAQ